MTTFAWIDELSAVVRGHRSADPTAPVTILVSTTEEALALRASLARAGDPVLHVGVAVDTPLMLAARGHEAASAWDLGDAVRRHSATGYFGSLDGLAGVTDALAAAVVEWDAALPAVRQAVLDQALSPVDLQRLQAIDALHAAVARDVSSRGLVLPSSVLAEPPVDDREVLWIDATVTTLSPIAQQWARRLRASAGEGRFIRFDPAGGSGPSVFAPVLTSAVDPVDECGLAARAVTGALEAGVAARDVVVAVPRAVLGRYRSLLGGLLASAGVPIDQGPGQPARLADTRVGRTLTAIGAAAAELRQPRDLRFDHVTSVITAGGLPDASGTSIGRRTLGALWRAVRGSDPARWSAGLDPDLGRVPADDTAAVVAAAATATRVARALEVTRLGTVTAQTWVDFAAVLDPLLPHNLVTGPVEAAARGRVLALLQAWSIRAGEGQWSQAWEEVAALLREPVPDPEAHIGVRIVPLSAAWATVPRLAVVVGLSDDLVPGTQGPVGPLAADEVMALRATVDGSHVVAENDARSLAAVQSAAGASLFSYARSDQLRTIERAASRFLAGVQEHEFGSIAAQFDAVDRREMGLLGAADAAASMLRTGAGAIAVAELQPDVDVRAAAACAQARRHPPSAGAVDRFNGDLRGLDPQQKERLSPDHRRTGADWASPSGLESMLNCPIGWWARRIIGVDESDATDPAVLEQPRWGSWLHRALVVLSERGLLLSDGLTDDDVADALWAALGGEPSAELDVGQADEEVLGYRFRVSEAEVVRAVRDVRGIATRLRNFLAARPARVGQPVHEADLPTGSLMLPSGPLGLGGRVDRIDTLVGDQHVITDYKTGRPGSGFQLAVYAWLWLLGHGGEAELLYATTHNGVYQSQKLHEGGGTRFTADDLEAFLRQRLADVVGAVRDGVLASGAGSKEHDRYCPVCGDLVATQHVWGSGGPRGERAIALASDTAAGVESPAVGQVAS